MNEVGGAGAANAVPPAAPAHPAPVAGDDQDRKKRQRLERNKECARECRRRKRDHTAELEARVAALEAENNHLQLQVQADGSNKVAEEADEEENEMAQMLAAGDAKELQAKIKEFGARHADYGTDRRVAVQWHLQQAEQLLVPTQGACQHASAAKLRACVSCCCCCC